jgi:hypothetical protein
MFPTYLFKTESSATIWPGLFDEAGITVAIKEVTGLPLLVPFAPIK